MNSTGGSFSQLDENASSSHKMNGNSSANLHADSNRDKDSDPKAKSKADSSSVRSSHNSHNNQLVQAVEETYMMENNAPVSASASASDQNPHLNMSVPIFVSNLNSATNKNSEDDSSVSSLDSCEESTNMSSSQPYKRSIFGSYWANQTATIHEESSCSILQHSHLHADQSKATTASSPLSELTHRTSSITLSNCSRESVTTVLPDEFAYQEFNRDFNRGRANSASDEYEKILKNNEFGRTSLPRSASLKEVSELKHHHHHHQHHHRPASSISPSPQKNITNALNTGIRTLFRNKYSASSPSLSYTYRDIQTPVRKTSSASSLRKKHRSILRDRSMSMDSTAIGSLQSHSATSRHSVSFDAKVFVHEYEKPDERCTNDGWSKFFSS